jgi:thioredoxin
MPLTVTDATFRAEVVDSDVPVLVDFWASWCAPCKMIAPIVQELSTEYDGRIKVVKVDIDANPVSPGQFGVMSIPTLLLFRDGKAEKRIVGYQPKGKLKAEIDTVLSSAQSA